MNGDKKEKGNKGQWRMIDKNMERTKDCTGLKTEASITEPILDRPLVKCPQCDPLKDSAWIKREKLQEHIKTAHFGFW